MSIEELLKPSHTDEYDYHVINKSFEIDDNLI